MQGRVGVVVQVVGIQSQPVVHGAEGRIVPCVLGIDAGLPQVVVGCRVAQHGVSLSQPDVGIEHAAVVVLPGVAYVQQPLAVVDGLAVVGLVQVMEHQAGQGFRIFRVVCEQLCLLAGFAFCVLCCAAERGQEEQSADDVS